jgi:hypothetical protein
MQVFELNSTNEALFVSALRIKCVSSHKSRVFSCSPSDILGVRTTSNSTLALVLREQSEEKRAKFRELPFGDALIRQKARAALCEACGMSPIMYGLPSDVFRWVE